MRGRRRTARRRLARAVLTVAVVFASVATVAPIGAAGPVGVDPQGSWGPLEDWPLIAIHSAVTPDGNVVTYGTRTDGRSSGAFHYDVWDPSGSAGTGHTTLPNTTGTDIFCSLQLVRPVSGDMILFGGDVYDPAIDKNATIGNPDITLYDVETQTLSTIGAMHRNRWYTTATTLPDGTVYLQGGYDDPDGFFGNDIAEHWSEPTGSIALPYDTTHLAYFYPRNFVTTDGRIFGFDVNGKMYFISPDLQTLTDVGRLPPENRGWGSSAVMFDTDKILQIGGDADRAVIIDVSGPTPVVTPTDNLSRRRHWVDATLLPDGRVLATGGSEVNNELVGVSLSAEIWDPDTGVWTERAEGSTPRLYHSTSLLLPDGRILVAGGGRPGPLINTNAEIYSPDYLVAAGGGPTARPSITSIAPGPFRPGGRVDLTVDDGSDIARVTLVKTGTVTHSFNFDQRFIEPDYSVTGDAISVSLPANAAELTPGFYFLWALDDNGIPSHSEMIQVLPPLVEVVPSPVVTAEGDGATTTAEVTVSLSGLSLVPVTADYTTRSDLGTATAGTDYQPTSGQLTFAPGERSKTIAVEVLGDRFDEPDETLIVQLTNSDGGRIGGYFGLGQVKITDDDEPAVLDPGGGGVTEGDSGTRVVRVPIRLTNPSEVPVSVSYETMALEGEGRATAGVDYTPTSGTVSFAPGETEKLVPVEVMGDTEPEIPLYLGEWVFVRFHAPVGAPLDLSFYGLGIGVIVDDD